jgi:putative transcriptional regulator
MAPAKGRLLIASPHLEDAYFSRAVILLCDLNEEGAFGFVLNRYVELNLPDLIKDLPKTAGRISLGGPVENNSLYYIHTLGQAINESLHVEGNIYLGGKFDALTTGLDNGSIAHDEVRFFVGYSGWGEGQLEEEIKQRSWYVRDLNSLSIMDTSRDDMWNEALRSMGGEFANLAHFPSDPKLN